MRRINPDLGRHLYPSLPLLSEDGLHGSIDLQHRDVDFCTSACDRYSNCWDKGVPCLSAVRRYHEPSAMSRVLSPTIHLPPLEFPAVVNIYRLPFGEDI